MPGETPPLSRSRAGSSERPSPVAGNARTLGVAALHRRAQLALRERVKELTCLYGIAHLAAQPQGSLEEILHAVVNLLPPAWLHTDLAVARIRLDAHEYATANFRQGLETLAADILIDGARRGAVEVAYLETMPPLDEGPFLREERHLIDTIAHELALITERVEAEERRDRLEEQLRHADRLATIGQLAAGVAHELNEPLGGILGFAQLARRDETVAENVRQDLDKIIGASLHAREVIRKLMTFARSSPTHSDQVNLNRIVEEGLYFLQARAARAGIGVLRELDPQLPAIVADPGQISQVLINLVVNALQATSDRGTIIIRTERRPDGVALAVADTGAGMPEAIRDKIFMPFFTTKSPGEGTGLGLTVVQGIIEAHGGSISVSSQVGRGSCFEVFLPCPTQASSGLTPLTTSDQATENGNVG